MLISMLGYAGEENSIFPSKDTHDAPASIVGVWSNQRSGFAESNIVFFDTGRGFLVAGVSAGYFKWKLLSTGIISVEIIAKEQPDITFQYDKTKKTITMEGSKNNKYHKIFYKKTNKTPPKDKVSALFEKERKKRQERKKKHEKNYNIVSINGISSKKVISLYKNESAGNANFSYSISTDKYPDKRFIGIGKRDGKYSIAVIFSDAIDNSVPRKLQKESLYTEKPKINLTERIFIPQDKISMIQSLFKTNVLKYKQIKKRIDYFEGYKTGYLHMISAKLDREGSVKKLSNILSLIADEYEKFNIRISKKRQ